MINFEIIMQLIYDIISIMSAKREIFDEMIFVIIISNNNNNTVRGYLFLFFI